MNSQKLISQIEKTHRTLLNEKDKLSIHKRYFKQLINKNEMLLKLGFPLSLFVAWRFNLLKYISRWGVKVWEWSLVLSNAKKFLIKG